MTYETVILGSGYFSLGYASTHKNTLIVEATQLADPNFFGTFDGFGMKTERPGAKGAEKLYDAFFKEGIIGEESLAVNELEPALCRFVSEDIPNVLFGSFCTEIKKNADGYELEICNNEGLSTIFAKMVIDARVSAGNKINILIALTEGRLPDVNGAMKAFYENQGVISLCFDGVYDINKTKLLALEAVEEKLVEVEAKIMGSSYRMCGAPVTDVYEDSLGITHIDERSFGDIFAAYEKGELWI